VKASSSKEKRFFVLFALFTSPHWEPGSIFRSRSTRVSCKMCVQFNYHFSFISSKSETGGRDRRKRPRRKDGGKETEVNKHREREQNIRIYKREGE
jgi:hypothetical protein